LILARKVQHELGLELEMTRSLEAYDDELNVTLLNRLEITTQELSVSLARSNSIESELKNELCFYQEALSKSSRLVGFN